MLVVVGDDYSTLKKRIGTTTTVTGASTGAHASTSTTTAAPATTTPTTVTPPTTYNRQFVPVDPKTGGPLVGCPG